MDTASLSDVTDIDHSLNPDVVALEVENALKHRDHERLYLIGLRFFQKGKSELFFPTREQALVRSADGDSLLHQAAACASGVALERLLAAGAEPNAQRDLGGTRPLHIACQHGHLKNVQILLEWHAYPNANDFQRRPPLWAACEGGHVDVVRALLQTGRVDVHTDLGDKNGTALQVACARGHLDLVRYLIEEAKAGVDYSTDYDKIPPPLYVAARAGQKAVVQYLVDVARVDPNHPYRRPLLDYAVDSQDEDMMCYILDLTTDVSMHTMSRIVSWNMLLFLRHMVQSDHWRQRLRELRDPQGNTLLFFAPSMEMAQLLVAIVGVDPNARNHEGSYALQYSVLNDHEEVVTYLIENVGVFVGMPYEVPQFDHAPFVMAVTYGRLAIAKRILAHFDRLGITISKECWQTLFSKSCQRGCLEMVQWMHSIGKSHAQGLRDALTTSNFTVADWLVFDAKFSLEAIAPLDAPSAVYVATFMDGSWAELSKTRFTIVSTSQIESAAKWLPSLKNVHCLYLDDRHNPFIEMSLLELESQMPLSHLEDVRLPVRGPQHRHQAILQRIAQHPVLAWNTATRSAWWCPQRHDNYPKSLREMIQTLLILARRASTVRTQAPIWALSDWALFYLFRHIGTLRYWPLE